MKLIIAGSRHWHFSCDFIRTIVHDIFGLDPQEVVCGGAEGVDDSGKRKFVAVLHQGPVTSPQAAVKAAIVSEYKLTPAT